jgi:hypothetical protein
MASQVITQGSKEFYIVSVSDALGILTDLSNAVPITFDVYTYDVVGVAAGNQLVTAQNAVLDVADGLPMSAYCLIDTTTGSGLTTPTVPVNGWWQTGDYHLFIKFLTGSEVPRKGPHLLTVGAGK